MKKFRNAFVLVAAGVIAGWMAPVGADTNRGRLLVENHCRSCHGSVVHERAARKVKSPAELRAFIARWSTELKLNWQEAEHTDVYNHLNSRYYHFAPKSAPKP